MKLVLTTALVPSLTPIASAQDYPGSFLQSDNFGHQLDRSQRNSSVHRTARPSRARNNESMRHFRPEYERRLRRDGKRALSFRGTAYRLGLEEGRDARR